MWINNGFPVFAIEGKVYDFRCIESIVPNTIGNKSFYRITYNSGSQDLVFVENVENFLSKISKAETRLVELQEEKQWQSY